ncbi:MAG: hypothetical protein IPK19_07705 [Chloroflexi bacterium]|nr:hypothetical protein [Chloroflexota bacterium]
MHTTADRRDLAIVDDSWVEGQFRSDYDRLNAYCSERYPNFALHRGTFEETLTPEFLETMRVDLPILIWIDCDYYTSARTVFERLIPYIPSACVVYFDEYDFNHGSRFTGEARIVYEINKGMFGAHVELVLDRALALHLNRVYRFINEEAESRYQRLRPIHDSGQLRRRTNDSPFP